MDDTPEPALDPVAGPVVMVSGGSRALRRRLRPAAWMALEEVALDSVVEDGRLIARTSARLVAERLGLAPDAAAGALKVLRQRGLLRLEPDRGGLGARFGLWIYTFNPIAGLAVIPATAATGRSSSPEDR